MRTSSKVFSIDANIILRYFMPDNPGLSAKAEPIMDSVARGELTVACDPVILAEVVFVLTRTYEQPRERICEALGAIVKSDNVLIPEKSRYVRALELYGSTQIHFGDACACATAVEDCEGRLLSLDRKLSRVSGIDRAESIPEPGAR